MEQMKIAEDKIVPLDFDSEELSFEIRELCPVVFREETSYWCLLGPVRIKAFSETVKRL
ncbi:hypothetical protein [Sphingobacterium sp. G1-14]|uniref:hypothetical protein n=1 Tax=Sphingobacterium TaxID=28453 RepID=UPI0012FE1749|nr:hypothetical protein [Sphingobacterium sp. G1-14]